MDVAIQLTCPCKPGFFYKNNSTFTMHKKSKMHAAWETREQNKSDKIRSKEFENEVERLRRRLAQRDDVEATLVSRIHQLEQECTYWRMQYQMVCPYVN
jgi:hypothetical protein